MPVRRGRVAGESVQQGHELVLGAECDRAVGDDHAGRSVGTWSSQCAAVRSAPMFVGVAGLRQQPPQGDGPGIVDVVPVDGGRRVDAQQAIVQAGAQVQHDRIRVVDDKPVH